MPCRGRGVGIGRIAHNFMFSARRALEKKNGSSPICGVVGGSQNDPELPFDPEQPLRLLPQGGADV